MNLKTPQYLMGHSDIGVTMNTYTHLGLEDATTEVQKLEEAEKEVQKTMGQPAITRNLFRAVK